MRTPDDVVEAVLATLPDEPVVLVAHSNAGVSAPLVADLGAVAATVYVDAALPPAGVRQVTAASGPFLELTYADETAAARSRGWPVWVLPGRHLEVLHCPRASPRRCSGSQQRAGASGRAAGRRRPRRAWRRRRRRRGG